MAIGDNLEQLGGVRKKLDYRFVSSIPVYCYFFTCFLYDDSEPIFEVPPPKYTAEQIIRILLNPCISKS